MKKIVLSLVVFVATPGPVTISLLGAGAINSVNDGPKGMVIIEDVEIVGHSVVFQEDDVPHVIAKRPTKVAALN